MSASHEKTSIYQPIAELHSTACDLEVPRVQTAGHGTAPNRRLRQSRRQTSHVVPNHSPVEAVVVALIHAGIWFWLAWCLW